MVSDSGNMATGLAYEPRGADSSVAGTVSSSGMTATRFACGGVAVNQSSSSDLLLIC